MSASRSLARSRRHLSQRQENWFSMRPAEELNLDALVNPNGTENVKQENSTALQEAELSV